MSQPLLAVNGLMMRFGGLLASTMYRWNCVSGKLCR